MDTRKIVSTNVNEYLEHGAHVKCISCMNCIREKKKVLQYKYQPNIKSNYGANFAHSGEHQTQAIWNLDHEKRKLKVPYNPPKNFVSSYAN